MNRIALCFAILIATTSALAADAPVINLRHTVAVEVVRKTKDAVVNISTTKLIAKRFSPFGDDPFWQHFDNGSVVRVPANSLGSGFIVHPEGYVITNNHVVDRARQITVELADGRKLPAELLSSDDTADLAILKIASDSPLPTLELGDSSDLMIGEPTIAVGNPLGFSHSVSTGIVSAVHRDLKGDNDQILLGDLIQTDAAINPGNSGGPLLNAYGQVIGINTAIRGDAQNIGFAIPVNKLRDLIPELMNPAQVKRIDIPAKLAESRKLIPPATVTPTIELIDAQNHRTVIAEIAGQRPRDIVDAYAILLKATASDNLTITTSAGKSIVLQPKPVPLPDAIVQARKRLGLTIEPVTPMLAEKYGLAAEDGLFVSEVAHNSVAAKAGLKPGDIILQLGRYRVRSLDDLSAILQHLPEHARVRIGVLRADQVGFGILDF